MGDVPELEGKPRKRTRRRLRVWLAPLSLLLIGLGVVWMLETGIVWGLLALWVGNGVEEAHNWIWRPTPKDLKWAEGIEGGAIHVRGPIVDAETGEGLTGWILINGKPVAEAVEVDVLMWATEEKPVLLRVEVEGYHPWELRFRFRREGLGTMEGPIRLKLKEGSDE